MTPARRQHQARRRIASVAAVADAAVVRWWADLKRLLERPPHPLEMHRKVRELAARIGEAHTLVGVGLANLAHDLHAHALTDAAKHLPRTVREDVDDPLMPTLGVDPLALVFEPMSFADAVRLVQAGGWMQRFAGQPGRDPYAIANLIIQGFSTGQTPRAIATALLPAVNGIRADARRIARTEGQRVAGAVQFEAHEQLGELVVGYRIHAVQGNLHSRKWHVERDGTEYFRHPRPGQKGFYQMPHPPFEAADPAERPVGAPQIAWNCLCWLEPILRE